MPKRSTKHRNIIPLSIRLSAGENLADPNHSIADNESPKMYNYIYRVNSNVPVVRPAIRCVTALAQKLTNPIIALHWYIKNASTSYLMCVSGDTLYYLNSSTEWVSVNAIEAGSKPVMVDFNGLLILADGNSSGLAKWDGTTFSRIAGSPEATVVIVHNNRLVCNNNNATGLDEVDFSKVEDEATWTYTQAGGAVKVRADYGSGLKVNGLASFYDNVIVSKFSATSAAGKRGANHLFRINTSGFPYDMIADGVTYEQSWTIEPLFLNTGARNERCLLQADNNVYFLADEGFSEIATTDRHGDLSNRQIGAKVNRALEQRISPDYWGLAYVPTWGCIAIMQKENRDVHVYFPWLTDGNGIRTGGFTRIGMGTNVWSAICQADDDIYLGGSDGYLYKIGHEGNYQDLVGPTTATDYEAIAQSKNFDWGYEGIVKRSELLYEPLSTGTVYLEYRDNDSDTITAAGNASYINEDEDLYTFTDDLGGLSIDLDTYPDQDLVKITSKALKLSSRAKKRSANCTFQVRTSQGRIGLTAIRAAVALVGE